MLPYIVWIKVRNAFNGQDTWKCCHTLLCPSWCLLSRHVEMLPYITCIKMGLLSRHRNVAMHCLDRFSRRTVMLPYMVLTKLVSVFKAHWNVARQYLDQVRVCFQSTLKCCHTSFGSSWSVLSIHIHSLFGSSQSLFQYTLKCCHIIVWIKLEYAFSTHWNVVIHCLDQARVCFQYTLKCCHTFFGSS